MACDYENCRVVWPLDEHHIIYEPKNTRLLCKTHHREITALDHKYHLGRDKIYNEKRINLYNNWRLGLIHSDRTAESEKEYWGDCI